jgi:L-arabinose isomerase
MDDAMLDRSVRLSLAVERLAVEHDVSGGSLNCHTTCRRNKPIGITACFSLGIQNNQGRSFTCTGDLPTALTMLLFKRLTGCGMYTEIQVMDELRRAIVISNSGEGEEQMRRPETVSKIRPCSNFSGQAGRGAAFTYPLRTGPATIGSLTPTPAGPKPFRLVVAEGEILEETLPDVGSIAGFFRFAHSDLHSAYTRWLETGPVHHAATTWGHHARDLAEVCGLIDVEFIGV